MARAGFQGWSTFTIGKVENRTPFPTGEVLVGVGIANLHLGMATWSFCGPLHCYRLCHMG